MSLRYTWLMMQWWILRTTRVATKRPYLHQTATFFTRIETATSFAKLKIVKTGRDNENNYRTWMSMQKLSSQLIVIHLIYFISSPYKHCTLYTQDLNKKVVKGYELCWFNTMRQHKHSKKTSHL